MFYYQSLTFLGMLICISFPLTAFFIFTKPLQIMKWMLYLQVDSLALASIVYLFGFPVDARGGKNSSSFQVINLV